MYHRTYNYDHLVVQFWLVPSTTNELPLACPSYTHFMIAYIMFLATQSIAFFHKFASVIF